MITVNINKRQERVIDFLREKQILGPDQIQWFVKFDGGRGEMNINDLFIEFAEKEIQKLEDSEEIERLINTHLQLMSLAEDEIACIKEVVISYARVLRLKIEKMEEKV